MLAACKQSHGLSGVMGGTTHTVHVCCQSRTRVAGVKARFLHRSRPGSARCSAQPETPRTQLVSLTPRPEKIVENQGSVNNRVLASAGIVCILTNCLTVQGLLLTAYLAAGVAVPALAAKHAIKHRNAWPIVALVVPILLVAQTTAGRALYMSAVNPMSVQIKARVTLPALIHAFIGAKHPLLATGMQSAKVISQVVLLALLLQYLVAPKVAESMRQKAIMLCRALTTTESTSAKARSGDGSALETWPNKAAKKQQPADSSFLDFVSRGSPTKFESGFGGGSQTEGPSNSLPEGQQPSMADILEKGGAQYSYAGSRSVEKAASRSSKPSQGHFNEQGYWQQSPAEASAEQAESTTELEIALESQLQDLQAGVVPESELDAVVDSISSPQELFAVLNEQLSMVQGLSEEIRDKGLALQHSEEAREDLVRELEATVGEKQELGEQLSQLALKLEAAQGMWERHAMEHDGGVSNMHMVTEEVLDKVVDALTERRRSIHTLADFEVKAVDPDALAARFRVFPEETAAAIMEGQVAAPHGGEKEHQAH